MNVREALEELLMQDKHHSESYDDDARLLAPIIEKALRAAYWVGRMDGLDGDLDGHHGCGHDQNGITAGVVAMVEES